jgi:integrase
MRDNLILRGNTYHVRLSLPEDVRPFFGNRKLLSQSLKTGLQQEAKDRARSILLKWKDEITQARQLKKSQAEQWREELAKASAEAKEALTQDVMSFVTEQRKPIPSHILDDTFSILAPFFDELVAGFQEDGADPALTSQLVNMLRQFYSEGDRFAAAKALNEFSKHADLQAAKSRYGLTHQEQEEASTILTDHTTYKPRSPIHRSMIDSWAQHLVTQIKTEKTRDRLKQSVQRFSDYLTSEGKPLTFDTVHSFLGTLPAARQTRANYLWAGRSFWKWANKYQPAFRDQFSKQPCPFDGHELPKTGAAAGVKRLAFTQQQIEALHVKALEKGSTPLANLIKFAAYTGARLEEIGRIRPEHTIFENGEPAGFKIEESKTDAGVRDMPLHPALVPLFKELSAKALENDGYLFPGGNNKYGNRLDGLSKQFGRLKAKDFGKDHTFHSIRHSVTTLLHQAGVSIEVLPYLLGHETGAFTLAQYSKGPSFNQKAEAISLLSYNFT